MIIRAYVDDELLYDSRSPSLVVYKLSCLMSLDKGGTAAIGLPPGHPGYGWGIWYRSIIRITRDDKTVFRGRLLYPADDMRGNRELIIEGERCLLRDAVVRPQTLTGTPSAIFRAVLAIYNTQVDAFKSFAAGVINPPTDSTSQTYVVEETMTVLAVLEDLCVTYGGKIMFTDPTSGTTRRINWTVVTAQAEAVQEIRVRRNLVDLKRQGNPNFATRLIPYGAADQASGDRLTISSENLGIDYLQNNDAAQIYGIITAVETWDDEADPVRLRQLAQARLDDLSVPAVAIEIAAADMSAVDGSHNPIMIGDTIRVVTPSHDLDTNMLVSELSVDWLHPAQNRIKLSASVRSLTSGVAEDNRKSTKRMMDGIKAMRRQIAVAVGGTMYTKDAVDLNIVTGVGTFIVKSSTAGTLVNRPTQGGVPVAGSATIKVTFGGLTTYNATSCTTRLQAYLLDSGGEYTRTLYIRQSDGATIGTTSWEKSDKSQYAYVAIE